MKKPDWGSDGIRVHGSGRFTINWKMKKEGNLPSRPD
jgi:hypothetical protein